MPSHQFIFIDTPLPNRHDTRVFQLTPPHSLISTINRLMDAQSFPAREGADQLSDRAPAASTCARHTRVPRCPGSHGSSTCVPCHAAGIATHPGIATQPRHRHAASISTRPGITTQLTSPRSRHRHAPQHRHAPRHRHAPQHRHAADIATQLTSPRAPASPRSLSEPRQRGEDERRGERASGLQAKLCTKGRGVVRSRSRRRSIYRAISPQKISPDEFWAVQTHPKRRCFSSQFSSTDAKINSQPPGPAGPGRAEPTSSCGGLPARLSQPPLLFSDILTPVFLGGSVTLGCPSQAAGRTGAAQGPSITGASSPLPAAPCPKPPSPSRRQRVPLGLRFPRRKPKEHPQLKATTWEG